MVFDHIYYKYLSELLPSLYCIESELDSIKHEQTNVVNEQKNTF